MNGTLRRILPAGALALLLPLLLFPRAFLGGEVVSADDHLFVHSAFASPDGPALRHPQLSDPAMQLSPLRQAVVQELRAGRAPLWNPAIFAGAPLLADAQSSPAAPPTLLRLVFDEDFAQDLGVAWVLAWTALGTALLAGALGAHPLGMALAAAAAGTAPFTGVWLLHPHAASFAWIPWLLWALERRWEGPAGLLVVSLCTAGLLGGGHPATIGHGLVLALGWGLLRHRDPARLLGLVLGLLLAAPAWLPVAEAIAASDTVGVRLGNRLLPAQLLDLVWPGFLGHPARDDWQGPGIWIDGQVHPGLAVLPLALWAARRPLGRRLWGLWLLALGLSLWGPVLAGNHARLLSEAAWLLGLAAGLATPQGPRGIAWLALVLGTGAWARRDDQASLPAAQHDPAPAPWVRSLCVELSCDAQPVRVLGLRHALQPDLAMRVGLRDLRGYDLPVSASTERLMAALDPRLRRPWYAVDDPPPAALLDLLGVRALLSPSPLAQARADLRPWTEPAPDAVYLRPEPGPRAWLATAPRRAQGPEQALQQAASDPEFRAHPAVEDLPGQWPAQGSVIPLSPVEEGGSLVRIAVDPPAPALLVLADAWAPGWLAERDGVATPVLRVGGALRGVLVQPGDREIVLRYQPWGWTWGLRLSAAGGLGLLLSSSWCMARRHRRSRRNSSSGPGRP